MTDRHADEATLKSGGPRSGTATDPDPSPLADRARSLDRLARESFDLLVVGGGVTGAGVARDAALRGLRVALVEREDFGAGTSSRSSRLVHGGVRYLEHGYLHLVFESSRERRTLLRIAPHLVRPLAFTWPVYAGARVPRWKLAAGLFLYDALALFRNIANHRPLSARGVREREPAVAAAVNGRALRGGATYYDAATDDARLTLATALSAAAAGAVVLNHAEVGALALGRAPDGRLPRASADVRDRVGGRVVRATATTVVNAAGPWSDAVRRLADPAAGAVVRGTKGVHILLPRERVGNHDALTLVAPRDGRVVFVLPAGAHAIVGTTDTPTDASPDEVRATRDDVRYLLGVVQAYFPEGSATEADVITAWAGIRPLAAGGSAADPSASSREHALHEGPEGLLSITGGKLTTYRSMAAEVVDAVERRLGRRPITSRTAALPLPGGDVASLDAVAAEAQAAVGDAEVARFLAESYGSAWRDAWTLTAADPSLAGRVVPRLPVPRAALAHAARAERALTLADALVRRTKLAFECRPEELEAAMDVCAAVMGDALGWSAAGRAAAVAAYRGEHARVFGIDP